MSPVISDKLESGKSLKIGLIVNPVAGLGGAVALKGSDGDDIVQKARNLGARPRALQRVEGFLEWLVPHVDRIVWLTWGGDMGENCLQARSNAPGWRVSVLGAPGKGHGGSVTHAEDTVQAAQVMRQSGADLIVFAGGDGTARDMVKAVGTSIPVLGIPAGVKIHSGVYAVHARGAAEIILKLLDADLVSVAEMEVRDINEDAFREGRVETRHYGELLVPAEERYLQHVKCSGREVEALVLQDIAAGLLEQLQTDHLYIVGPGTTTRALFEALGLEKTLLGVDLLLNETVVQVDATEQQILDWVQRFPATIVVTLIGGQGHIFGRGNHQISPPVIRKAEDIIVISTKSKLRELEGRPLVVDTWDAALNSKLSGFRKVITGYDDAVLYPVEG